MPKVIASIDDGSKLDMRAAELMDKYGVECIFYIPVRWDQINTAKGRGGLSQQDFADLASRFEIGSHTINHPLLTRIDPELAQYEIRKSRQLLQEMTGQPINSFCPPRGYFDYRIKEMVADAGYQSMRTVRVGNVTTPIDPLETDTTVHVYNGRKEYQGRGWLSYARSKWREAQESPDGYFHLWLHSWEVERDGLWGELELFLGEL